MSDKDDDDKVGYGRPPKGSRFRPGQSGNPKGRPKGQRNFQTDVLEILNAAVRVKERGEARTLTSQQAALYRLREKALNGDARSLNRLLDLAARFNGEALVHDSDAGLAEDDQAILEQYLSSSRSQARGNAATAEDKEGQIGPDEESENE
ncbi:DUF5681 domain-containing protein [Minwuia sp. IMCC3060]|uniref:DUF5681 domain-containing protein n=1 Tax=Minwuia sp. IMCC3060 TaxID=3040675 RepID=UPI00247A079F|nr:DUF5681 domain-containing protein [Minwuia sp. IMCC3060]